MTDSPTAVPTSESSDWRVFAIAFPLVFVVLCARGAAILINPQPIWDDKNFIADGIFHPGPANWFAPYAGYMLVLPRIISDWFTLFNLLDAPLWGALFSMATMTWAFCLVLSAGFEHLLPLRWRMALVAAMTVMPWHTEVFAAICNIHWLFFAGLALLSLARYERMGRVTRWLLPPATALLIFSTANSVLALPVFALRAVTAWRRGPRYALWYASSAVCLIAAYAMITVAVTATMPSSWPGRIELSNLPALPMFLHYLIKGVGYKVVTVSTVGGRVAVRLLATPVAYTGAFLLWAALASFAIAMAVRRERFEATVSVAAIIYYTLATIVFSGLFRSDYVIAHFIRDGQYYGADRYFVAPALFFYLLLLWTLVRVEAWRSAALATLACVVAAAAVLHFFYPPQTDHRWRESVLHYYEALLAAHGSSTAQFRIVVHPPAPEWNLVLPVYELSAADRRRIQRIVADQEAQ